MKYRYYTMKHRKYGDTRLHIHGKTDDVIEHCRKLGYTDIKWVDFVFFGD